MKHTSSWAPMLDRLNSKLLRPQSIDADDPNSPPLQTTASNHLQWRLIWWLTAKKRRRKSVLRGLFNPCNHANFLSPGWKWIRRIDSYRIFQKPVYTKPFWLNFWSSENYVPNYTKIGLYHLSHQWKDKWTLCKPYKFSKVQAQKQLSTTTISPITEIKCFFSKAWVYSIRINHQRKKHDE